PPPPPLFPYTTLFRSFRPAKAKKEYVPIPPEKQADSAGHDAAAADAEPGGGAVATEGGAGIAPGLDGPELGGPVLAPPPEGPVLDRKSTRLNSSHRTI